MTLYYIHGTWHIATLVRAVLYCTILHCTALYCTVHPGRLRDGPEVQQVAQGGLLHRQGAQVQGQPRDQV